MKKSPFSDEIACITSQSLEGILTTCLKAKKIFCIFFTPSQGWQKGNFRGKIVLLACDMTYNVIIILIDG